MKNKIKPNLKEFEEKYCKNCALAYTIHCYTPEECNIEGKYYREKEKKRE